VAKDSRSTQLYDARRNPLTALEPRVELALGNINGRTSDRKFGFNPGVDSAAEETVWEPGGRIDLLSSAEIINIVSSSALDAVGGSGAITVKIFGVSGTWQEIQETLTLTGETPVATVNQYQFINRVRVASAGSGRTNAGRIEATAAVSGNILAAVPIGYGVTQQVVFAVPTGKVALIERFEMIATKLAGGAKPLVTGRIREHIVEGEFSGTTTIIFEEVFDTDVTNLTTDQSLGEVIVPPCTVVEMSAITDTNSTGVFGRFEYQLIEV
jgi:hypothetical protein